MINRFTEQNLKEIIKHMFDIAWIEFISLEELNKDENWFTNNTYTQEQEDEFREWLTNYLKDYTIKYRLEKEVENFILNYGLKVKK